MKEACPKVCFTLLLFFFGRLVPAQSVDCENIGFETGTTNGWVLTYGTVTDQNQKTVFVGEMNGTRDNEHYVTKLTDGNDPKITAEDIPMVAPGSRHSIRIGNMTTGTRFSRISTKYKVTPDNSLFQYQFAIILQNPGSGGFGGGHAPYQKPGFNILIFDEAGDELPCSNYDIQLEGTNTVAGFKSQGDLQYRNWTKGAIDLTNSIGRTITIVVTVHGCTQRGHFGYAYFDAECFRSELDLVSKCPDENGLVAIKAPEGFAKYEWSNGATQSVARVPGVPGETYSVSLYPHSSLDENCRVQLKQTLRYTATEAVLDETICEGEVFAVGDTTYATSGRYVRKIVSTPLCDSTVTLNLKVNRIAYHEQSLRICAGDTLTVGDTTLTTPGTYEVAINRGILCDSIVTTHLRVDDFNYVEADTSFSVVQGDEIELDATILPVATYHVFWDPPTGLSCGDCVVVTARPEKSTVYTVRTVNDEFNCPLEKTFSILVRPCEVILPDAFTPDLNGTNDVIYPMFGSCIIRVKEFTIYDRWGEVVFHQNDIARSEPSHGWDGTYRGIRQPGGIFVYKVVAERKDGKEIVQRGAFAMIR